MRPTEYVRDVELNLLLNGHTSAVATQLAQSRSTVDALEAELAAIRSQRASAQREASLLRHDLTVTSKRYV